MRKQTDEDTLKERRDTLNEARRMAAETLTELARDAEAKARRRAYLFAGLVTAAVLAAVLIAFYASC